MPVAAQPEIVAHETRLVGFEKKLGHERGHVEPDERNENEPLPLRPGPRERRRFPAGQAHENESTLTRFFCHSLFADERASETATPAGDRADGKIFERIHLLPERDFDGVAALCIFLNEPGRLHAVGQHVRLLAPALRPLARSRAGAAAVGADSRIENSRPARRCRRAAALLPSLRARARSDPRSGVVP